MRLLAREGLARDTPSDGGHSCLVNSVLATGLGGAAAVSARVDLPEDSWPGSGPWTIAGVVTGSHLGSLHHRVEPTVLMLDPELAEDREQGRLLVVRLAPAHRAAVLAHAAMAWHQVARPDVPLRYSYLDDDLARFSREDRRWTRTVTWGAGG